MVYVICQLRFIAECEGIKNTTFLNVVEWLAKKSIQLLRSLNSEILDELRGIGVCRHRYFHEKTASVDRVSREQKVSSNAILLEIIDHSEALRKKSLQALLQATHLVNKN